MSLFEMCYVVYGCSMGELLVWIIKLHLDFAFAPSIHDALNITLAQQKWQSSILRAVLPCLRVQIGWPEAMLLIEAYGLC